MLRLFIDDGVPDRTHRKNMLSREYTGIAYCVHQ
jgi:uncharacterized protein YkwD